MTSSRAIAVLCCLLLAGFTCKEPEPARVTMAFTNNPPIENGTLSSAQLGGFHISTTFSKSHRETFSIGGLTVSDVVPRFLVTFKSSENIESGLTCLYAESIELQLEYSPTIYIAREFRPGTCRYREVLLHEVRHVNTDIITINEYLPQMQAAVQAAANALVIQGPLKPHELLPAREQAVTVLKDALKGAVDGFSRVQFQRQQAIDTRQEYLRSSRACPDEPLPGGR